MSQDREARYRRVECGAFSPETEFRPQRGSHPSPVKHTLGSADVLGILSCWQQKAWQAESCPPPDVSLMDTVAQLSGALCPGTNAWVRAQPTVRLTGKWATLVSLLVSSVG